MDLNVQSYMSRKTPEERQMLMNLIKETNNVTIPEFSPTENVEPENPMIQIPIPNSKKNKAPKEQKENDPIVNSSPIEQSSKYQSHLQNLMKHNLKLKKQNMVLTKQNGELKLKFENISANFNTLKEFAASLIKDFQCSKKKDIKEIRLYEELEIDKILFSSEPPVELLMLYIVHQL